MKKIGITFLVLFQLINGSKLSAHTEFSYFAGGHFATGPKFSHFIEVVHTSQWKYGDNLFYFDITSPYHDQTSVYSEIDPRLSLSKMTETKVQYGFIEDVLIAAKFEAEENMRAYNFGIGFNLVVPQFRFLILNLYWRHNPVLKGSTFQEALSWGLPFSTGKFDWNFAGFAVYTGPLASKMNWFVFRPKLVFDIGKLLKIGEKSLYAGLQYVYWYNKLGIKGRKESALTWIVTWDID